MSLVACTTPQPRDSLPPVLEAKPTTPAECLRSALARTPAGLATLPAGFKVMTADAQSRVLLKLKAADTLSYVLLRGTALRCAPEA